MQINKNLVSYIEKNIFPKYEKSITPTTPPVFYKTTDEWYKSQGKTKPLFGKDIPKPKSKLPWKKPNVEDIKLRVILYKPHTVVPKDVFINVSKQTTVKENTL